MKFSDIEHDSWDGLKPYLDTCLLPVTGLTGREEPWEATRRLEALRDLMDPVEGPFRGRVVTYPAFHYIEGKDGLAAVDAVCARLKREAGFRFLIIAALDPTLDAGALPHADLILTPQSSGGPEAGEPLRERVGREVRALWQSGAASAGGAEDGQGGSKSV